MADAGGWTDTWFATGGTVCSVAVRPGAVARVAVGARSPVPTCSLHVQSFGHRYTFPVHGDVPGRHPLLEAAVRRFAPTGVDLDVEVGSAVPPGSGVGTSAAVCVALVAALVEATGERSLHDVDVAGAAHRIETEDLGLQSGVQDQAAAVHGGALRIDVPTYPATVVERLAVPPSTWAEVERRTVTVYLGRPHRSSEVHRTVIERLEAEPTLAASLLPPLREAAVDAAGALVAGDLEGWAAALVRNTEAQARLHPDLVSDGARAVVQTARRSGALGWKVNGAGGDGGTVTVVAGDRPEATRTALADAGLTLLALRPSAHGLVVRRR